MAQVHDLGRYDPHDRGHHNKKGEQMPAPNTTHDPAPRATRRAEFLATRPRRSGQSHRYLAENPATGESLPVTLHADAKTTPTLMLEQSGRATATVANAWALPAGPPKLGGTCSRATQACQSCYACSLEAAYPSLARMLIENLTSLRTVAAHGTATLAAWLESIVRASVAEQTAVGIARPTFRWHSDGDLGALVGTGMDRRIYPRAIRRACAATPEVAHWIYTRETWALPYLLNTPNLRVLVSVDRYNLTTACHAAARHDVPIALLADDEQHAAQMWQTIRTNWPTLAPQMDCPATSRWKQDGRGPAHIVGPDGKRTTLERGQPAVGACVACQACLPGGAARSVTFHMHNPGNRMAAALNTRKRLQVTAL